MKRCLQLAAMGRGQTAPNPMVGAVLVYNGRILSEGWHQAYGDRHAETNCLNAVAAEDRHLIPGSTMYVSLEPCAHHGKTPPCAERLVSEQVKRVVIANMDPYEAVRGKGVALLTAAGIPVTTDICSAEGRWQNRRFFCTQQQKRPYILLKWAQTHNGLFAPADNRRQQLSNHHSRQLVHRWRTEESAILIGTNTALYDDPLLTARYWQGRQPLRIVIDRNLRLPTSLQLFSGTDIVWILNEQQEGQTGNLRYIRTTREQMLPVLMKALYEAGMLSLIIEGGAALLQYCITRGYWDEARIFHTPDILQAGIPAPILQQADTATSFSLGSDTLYCYTHRNSQYPYIAGMEF